MKKIVSAKPLAVGQLFVGNENYSKGRFLLIIARDGENYSGDPRFSTIQKDWEHPDRKVEREGDRWKDIIEITHKYLCDLKVGQTWKFKNISLVLKSVDEENVRGTDGLSYGRMWTATKYVNNKFDKQIELLEYELFENFILVPPQPPNMWKHRLFNYFSRKEPKPEQVWSNKEDNARYLIKERLPLSRKEELTDIGTIKFVVHRYFDQTDFEIDSAELKKDFMYIGEDPQPKEIAEVVEHEDDCCTQTGGSCCCKVEFPDGGSSCTGKVQPEEIHIAVDPAAEGPEADYNVVEEEDTTQPDDNSVYRFENAVTSEVTIAESITDPQVIINMDNTTETVSDINDIVEITKPEGVVVKENKNMLDQVL